MTTNFRFKVGFLLARFCFLFARNLQRKASAASGTKQLSVAKGGVFAVQPEGAWRKAAQFGQQRKQRGCSFLFASRLQRTSPRGGELACRRHGGPEAMQLN
jgi:hypothetical protein